jgi:hypothetical protein
MWWERGYVSAIPECDDDDYLRYIKGVEMGMLLVLSDSLNLTLYSPILT